MKLPEECKNMKDVKNAVDNIDMAIIDLIGQRAEYLNKATNLKLTVFNQNEMLNVRRKWAEESNLSPDLVQNLYEVLESNKEAYSNKTEQVLG
ncbi:MAG: chorismate mutase [Ichthyobacteriaceae bacterium]|nr:chorismate mutase [Ichthyobacteriaceae bacterium]